MDDYNRRTVARYRRWAQEQGVLEGPLLSAHALEERLAATWPAMRPPQQRSSVDAYRAGIEPVLARSRNLYRPIGDCGTEYRR